MNRIFALTLALCLLLCGCGREAPAETTLGGSETQATPTETLSGGEGEGILDPTTEIRYLIVKKIVTNDAGQELWGTEYSYDDTGFCTHEREYSTYPTDKLTPQTNHSPIRKLISENEPYFSQNPNDST